MVSRAITSIEHVKNWVYAWILDRQYVGDFDNRFSEASGAAEAFSQSGFKVNYFQYECSPF